MMGNKKKKLKDKSKKVGEGQSDEDEDEGRDHEAYLKEQRQKLESEKVALLQNTEMVERNRQVGWISNFLKKQVQADTEDQVFLYINQCFCPSPDQEVGALFDLYESGKKLVLHYCLTPAWG